MVIALACLSNLGGIANSQNRASRVTDIYEKCPAIIITLIKLATNFGTIIAFPSTCGLSDSTATSSLGPGWFCLLFSVLLGNIPEWIIDIMIPAPSPEEIAVLTAELEMPNASDTTAVEERV